MTLEELLQKANDAYGDNLIIGYFSDPDDESMGDTLALFIMRELSETFDKNASEEDQLAEAARVMSTARDEIERVIAAFEV